LIDLSLLALMPLERAMGNRWVEQARSRLASSGARVVAITGSYGKTTTKQYVAHLLAGSFRTVASPASFNNRMGLARAVNEQLAPGTEVFVAEMGTYGRGEIAEMCSWTHPEVSAIVSIGPVHLERFRSEENIVAAKSEILEGVKAGVIAVDHPLLASLAREREGSIEVITVATRAGARVEVAGGRIEVDGQPLAPVPEQALEVNLGVAIGICLALGLAPHQVVGRLEGLPRPEHRQTVTRSERGFTVIDDTYNSNPAGARLGLERLVALSGEGRKVLVTPGMVELGPRQQEENRVFASAAAGMVDDILIVGSTNRASLLAGSSNGGASVTVVASRDEAVSWVREHLGPGDAVLYENDLPDPYP
jgi:UDP-N-acetylmuramoyl-tripeptide--D-alanyl-D-alanine ligase